MINPMWGIVQGILAEIEAGGDAAALKYAEKFDKYAGNTILTADEIAAAAAKVPQKLKDDIAFAHDNVRRFAEMQKGTLGDVQMEILPGLVGGQKVIPVNAAGCYIPGGRYSHIASAIMTVTTAKVAGVKHITACSPPALMWALRLRLFTPHTYAGPIKFWPWAGCRALPP